MQELPLSSKYPEIYSEIVVLAVNYLNQAIFYVLRDIKDTREIHDPLLMPAWLADTTDH